jgi:hypothetical protein
MDNYQNNNAVTKPKKRIIKIVIIIVAVIFSGWLLLSLFIVKQMNPEKTGSVANRSLLSAVDKSFSAAMEGGLINSELKPYYKDHGTYSGFETNYKNNTYKDCSSDVTIIISPDGSKYVTYRPLCSDREKIFCYDSTSEKMTELSKNSISIVESSFKCK